MNVFTTIAWAVPILTGGGAAIFVALLFAAPAAAAAIENAVLKILSGVLSTRIGCAALAAALVFSPAYLYGDARGAARVQAEWDHAEDAAAEQGAEVRTDAEKEIPDVEPEAEAPADTAAPAPQHHFPWIIWKRTNACPPPATARPVCRTYDDRGVRNDPYNRDHH